MSRLATTTYKKKNSFESIFIKNPRSNPLEQSKRAVKALNDKHYTFNHNHFSNFFDVIERVKKSLNLFINSKDNNTIGANVEFIINALTAEEMSLLSDDILPLYLYHRFRYEVLPVQNHLDSYPPYVQIEPSSVCNYRCAFCYQTDKSFSNPGSMYMGTMSYEMYKEIIDMLEGKTEFLSLASRGEPFLCKELPRMLAYSANKFLNLKINTNASLLNEERIHSLLSGGTRTIVFSIDAPEKELYESLRVNGRIEVVEKKLKLFHSIKEKHYSKSKIITRVSGVYLDERQNMSAMKEKWGDYVDQITFVKYNPWENVYESEESNIITPCSDLWRRLFIWYDGKVNPCDTDYKSSLSIGSLKDYSSLSDLWNSELYNKLRELHIGKQRDKLNPCKNCVVI